MSKTTYVNANVVPTYDTFAGWLTKTNQIIYDMGVYVLTTSNTTSPDVTTGNAYVNGYFGSNTVYVYNGLQGGTANTPASLVITSTLTVSNTSAFSGNLTITGSANASVNVNAVGLLANNITANNNLIVSNTSTLNVATVVTANITTANITTLGVTSLATVANATVTTANVTNMTVSGTANIATANITTLYVSSLESAANLTVAVANVTNMTISGTANVGTANVTTLGVTGTATIATGVVTTANITNETISGTSNIATANITTLGVTGVGTIATVRATTANLTTANITTLGVTGTATIATGVVTTANITNSTTSGTANIGIANVTTLGVTGTGTIATAVVTTANITNSTTSGTANIGIANVTTLGVTGVGTIATGVITTANITNETISGTSNIATANITTLGVTGTATIATGVLTTANITNSTTSGTANIGIANVTTLGVTGVTTVPNLNIGTAATANITANSSTVSFANATVTATINATNYSGTSANATLFAGQTLATIQGQITSNATTAYTNAIAIAANATNITSGTIGAGFLPASTVNTSGAFTIAGVLNHTANLVVTGNTTAVLTVGNNLTTNVTSNATTLTVQAGATIGAVTANSTTITVGNASVSTTVNATSFSGTATQASNATNLNSQPASYYTNATNITTGTLPSAQLPSVVTNTSAAFTIGGVWNWTANLVVTGNTTAVLTVGNNNTSNITANATALTIQGAAAVGSILANSTQITVGNATVNATINSTAFSGLAANANYANAAGAIGNTSTGLIPVNTSTPTDGYVLAYDSATSKVIFKNPSNITTALNSNVITANAQLQAGSNGSTYVANLYGNATTTAATFRANVVSLQVDSGSILLNSSANVNGTLTVGTGSGNNVIANNTVVAVGNTTVNTTINATSFSGTAANAALLGGSSLATIQSQITGNAATAYSNAIANSANATNITSGTIGAGFLPAVVVNTSGAFTIGGILNYTANLVVTGNTTAVLTVGNNNTSNITANAVALTVQGTSTVGSVTANSTQITVGNATIQTTINATSFSGTAANAALLGGSSLATIQSQITGNAATAFANAIANAASNAAGIYQTTAGLSANVATLTSNNSTNFGGLTLAQVQGNAASNAATAYTNATTFAANATNITSGTVAPARLGSGTTDSTTILYGNGVWVSVGGIATNAAAQYNWTNTHTFNANVTFASGNATNQLLVGTIGSGNGVAIQNTGIQIGNTGASVTINSTAFSGTANNASFLGGSTLATIQGQITGNASAAYSNAVANAAALYQTTAGLSANVATLTSNNSTNFGGSSLATIQSQITGNAATAFANAIANAYSNAQATYYLKTGGTISGDVVITGNLNITGTTVYANVTNLDVKDLNITVAKGAASNAASDGAGLTVDIPGATLTYSGSANTWNVNRGFAPTSNLTFDLGGSTLFWQNVYANTLNLTGGATLNATSYSGTAANASALSSVSLATIQSQITGNAATAYSNAVANAIANSANATNITSGTIGAGFLPASTVNTSGAFTITGVHTYNANILFSGNATSQVLVGTIAAGNGVAITNGSITIGNNSVNATINSTSFTGSVTQAANATNLNSQPASYYTNATNITTGTLNIAQIPAAVVNTSGAFTLGGVFTFNSNVSLASGNATNQVLVGTIAGGNGVVISNTGISVGNSTVNTTINSTSFSGTAANASLLASTTLATIQSQITGNAATAFSNAIANASSSAAALYQTTAGLSANVATLSAGSVGGNTAATLRAYSDTAYTNATAIAANATNLANGTVPVARLGSGTANSTTVLYGNNVWAAIVGGATLTANNTDTQTFYLPMANTTSGAWANAVVSTTKLSFVPSTGVLTATSFTGAGTGLTGTAASLTAGSASALGTATSYQVGSLGVGTAASGSSGEIRASNNITAYYSSDSRLKTNVVPIANALDSLKKINGVRFDWTDEYIEASGGEDGFFVRKHDVGVIAQEVQAVLPEVVAERGDGYLAVKYEKIIALLIQSIKEQQEQIEELKEKINGSSS